MNGPLVRRSVDLLSEAAVRLMLLALLVMCAFIAPAHAKRGEPYFSVTTSRSFAPGEKPKISLYARNEDELEFRIYKVKDPAKFFLGLPDPHSFGARPAWSPDEQIDKPTLLERFHDWKRHLWYLVRHFYKGQLSGDTIDALREKQAVFARKSRVVGAAQFAQIPLLNASQLVARWKLEVPPNFLSNTDDLPLDALPAGLYLLEATDGRYKAYTLISVTQIAIITRAGQRSVLAYTVDRQTGQPHPTTVTLRLGNQPAAQQKTSADGLSRFNADPARNTKANRAGSSDKKAAGGDAAGGSDPSSDDATDNAAQEAAASDTSENGNDLRVLAQDGDNIAILAPFSYALDSRGGTELSGYVYTDRPVYRPGQTVDIKGVLRQWQKDGLVVPAMKTVHVTVTGPDNKLLDKDLDVSSFGTANTTLQLPADAKLGYYSVTFGKGFAATGSFDVQEYRKPEYFVKVTPAKVRVLEGDSVQVSIEARYFFGEPVAGAAVKYTVHHSTHYWWGEDADDTAQDDSGGDTDDSSSNGDDSGNSDNAATFGAEEESEQTGKLDANGRLTVTIPTRVDSKNHEDLDYHIQARVTDAAQREVDGGNGFLATYGNFRIHADVTSYVLAKGQPAKLKLQAVDYDNKPVQAHIHVQAVNDIYNPRAAAAEHKNLGSADADTDAQGNATATVDLQGATGAVRLTASAPSGQRSVQDSAYLYVPGRGESAEDENGGVQQGKLLADKKKYAPGDIAHLTLVSDAADAYALITVNGATVQSERVVHAQGASVTFDVPITTAAVPALEVNAVFISAGQLYQASKTLNVPPDAERLQISIAPQKQTFQPEEKGVYDIEARDATGKPVAAELSFGVVDEAIYSVEPDSSGDIVKRLWSRNSWSESVDSSLDYQFTGEAGLKNPELAMLRRRQFHPLLAQVKQSDLVTPKVRKAFPDTAYWNANVVTNDQGHATVTVPFPDALTTWRTTVRAVTRDSLAGSSVNKIIVRKNIIVRLAAPRFFRQGDDVVLPVIVHNYLPDAKSVQLQLDVQGLSLVSGQTATVTIPSKGETEALWRVHASQIGTARLTAKALTNEESDAIETDVPVEAVGVPKTVAESGAITGVNTNAVTTMTFATNTDQNTHTLDVSVSASVAGSLFTALDYLTSYPYGCAEQTMSSFLPNIIVSQTMAKLKVPGRVDQAKLQSQIRAGLARLYDYQHEDGGWGWWKDDPSRVFMTAYVTAGLEQAKAAGYDVKPEAIAKGQAWLQKALDQHPRMIAGLQAYVMYALSLDGKARAKDLNNLWSKRGDMKSKDIALAGLAFHAAHDSRDAAAVALLWKSAQQEGDGTFWQSGYDSLLEEDSDDSAEATAFALKLMSAADAYNPALSKVALWLVTHRDNGYWWNTTKTTAMALYGLTDYLAATHELNADFDAEVLVNGANKGKRHFSAADAASGATLSIRLAGADLQPGANRVEFRRTGAGRLYWSTHAVYYTQDKHAYQQGTVSLNVSRDYFRLVQQTAADNTLVYALQPFTGTAQVGDVLAVHLVVSGTKAKYLLVEDPIPSGTEYLAHPELYRIRDKPDWQWSYTERELHDDRVATFATDYDGHVDSFYLIKITNAGSFAVSPAFVQPMYQPDVQATTDPFHLEVK